MLRITDGFPIVGHIGFRFVAFKVHCLKKYHDDGDFEPYVNQLFFFLKQQLSKGSANLTAFMYSS